MVDELIQAFINRVYTQEVQEDISRIFSLFDNFDYNDVDADLINIISLEDFTTLDSMQDQFINCLHTKLDYLLEQHAIKLNNNVSLSDKYEILNALFVVQQLEDYHPIIMILENIEQDDNYKLASIISELSSLNVITLMEMITFVHPGTLDTLKQFIYTREKPEEKTKDVRFNTILKQFFAFLKGRGCLGLTLLRAKVSLGGEFTMYLPFVKNDIIALSDNQTALNFLSVLMISQDGQLSPLLTFRKHSQDVFDNINFISKVESHLSNIYNEFLDYKGKEDEKIRLSQISS